MVISVGRVGVARQVSHGVLHVLLIIAIGEVVAHVTAAALLAVTSSEHEHLCEIKQEAQLNRLEQVGVKPPTAILDANVLVAVAQVMNHAEHLGERVMGAEHLSAAIHRLLQLATNVGDALGAGALTQRLDQLANLLRRICGKINELGGLRIVSGVVAASLAEHVDVEQRVRAKTVRAVH